MKDATTPPVSPRRGRRVIAGAGVAGVLVLGLGAGAVVAQSVLDGTSDPNDLEGTSGADVIRGFGGNDDLYGFGGDDVLRGGGGWDDIEGGDGDDRLFGGPGRDDLDGGPGDDRIRAVDRHHDDIECGVGFDRVWANPGDDVSADCERVVRRGVTVTDPGNGPGDVGAAPVAPMPGGVISASEAGRIAAAHVGGVVDDIETERDHGAAWEVDVYAPQGEYTIYVSATGEIVRVEGPFRW